MNKDRLVWMAGALALMISAAIFLFSCFVTASDGQGAMVFILAIPLIGVMLGLNLVWLKPISKPIYGASLGGLVFLGLFFFGAFIPGVRLIPETVIGGVAVGFEKVTGFSPYVWVRSSNDIGKLLDKELLRTQGKSIDFSAIRTRRAWIRLCVFGPYATAQDAKAALGFAWDLDAESQVRMSDGFDALVLIDEKPGATPSVVYAQDYSRARADLASLSGRCFARSEAKFERREGASPVFVSR